jgi:hypothetical protein
MVRKAGDYLTVRNGYEVRATTAFRPVKPFEVMVKHVTINRARTTTESARTVLPPAIGIGGMRDRAKNPFAYGGGNDACPRFSRPSIADPQRFAQDGGRHDRIAALDGLRWSNRTIRTGQAD